MEPSEEGLHSETRSLKGGRSLPLSVIIPTRNRAHVLMRTLDSLFEQSEQPAQLLIIDSSTNDMTKNGVAKYTRAAVEKGCELSWISAVVQGAAAQRNQGLLLAVHPMIGFFM